MPLEGRQRPQAHLEDRVGLPLAELEALHESSAGIRSGLRGANDRDHFVEVVERDLETFEQMRARLGLSEIVGGPTHHDFCAEIDEMPQCLFEREQLGPVVYQREHVHTKRRLQWSLLVELVEDHLVLCVAAQLDHDPHALAI